MDIRYKMISVAFIVIFATTKVYSGVSQIDTNYYKISLTNESTLSYGLPIDSGIQACVVDAGASLKDKKAAIGYFLLTTGEEESATNEIEVATVSTRADCMREVGENSTLMLTVNGQQGVRDAFVRNLKGIFNV